LIDIHTTLVLLATTCYGTSAVMITYTNISVNPMTRVDLINSMFSEHWR